MEHKFEPFEKVLVRDYDGDIWKCSFYSHKNNSNDLSHHCLHCDWRFCIPYAGNEHLLGTRNNPEPKHEYQWGDKVEVLVGGDWLKGIIINTDCSTIPYQCAFLKHDGVSTSQWFDGKAIRQLKEDE